MSVVASSVDGRWWETFAVGLAGGVVGAGAVADRGPLDPGLAS